MGQIFVAGKPYEGHPYFNRTTTVEITSDEYYPTKESDARLIAAAPELLEALKSCPALKTDNPEWIEFYKKASRAVAKAEGNE